MDVLSFSTLADQIKKEINHKCGLNLSQTRILLYFDSTNNTAITMGKLAQALKISLSTLSRQLQQKRTQTLIVITRSEKDSSKSVNLSKNGLQKVAELKIVLNNLEQELFSSLSKTELDNFTKDLELLTKEFTNVSELE